LAAIIKKDKEAVQKLMSHKDINLDMQYFGKTVKDLLEEEIKENPEDEISKEILKILQSPEHK
jgi:hypothetical protein